MPVHTLFQISTSGALVEGIYEKAVSSNLLLHYGDFGLGTFDNLDGEMVVLDGAIYQVRSDGTVMRILDDTGTPFAVVVRFMADQEETTPIAGSFEDLKNLCDKYRDSANLFYAVRVDGHFDHVRTRAMKATLDGLIAGVAGGKRKAEREIWLKSRSEILSRWGNNGGNIYSCRITYCLESIVNSYFR